MIIAVMTLRHTSSVNPLHIGSSYTTSNYSRLIPPWLNNSPKATLIQKTNNIFGRDKDMYAQFIQWRNTLVYTSVILFLLYLGLGGAFLGLSLQKDKSPLSGNLYFNMPVYDVTTYSYTTTTERLTPITYHVWWIAVGFLGICLIFLLLGIIAGMDVFQERKDIINIDENDIAGIYYEMFLVGGNRTTWFLKALLDSAILWIVAVLCGITDVIVLVLLAAMNVSLMFIGGLVHEWINSDITEVFRFDSDHYSTIKTVEKKIYDQFPDGTFPEASPVRVPTSEAEYLSRQKAVRVKWLPLVTGIVLFFSIWSVLFVYFATIATDLGIANVPWYITTSLFVYFGFSMIFMLIVVIFSAYVQSQNDKFLHQSPKFMEKIEIFRKVRTEILRRNAIYEFLKLLFSHLASMAILVILLIAIYIK